MKTSFSILFALTTLLTTAPLVQAETKTVKTAVSAGAQAQLPAPEFDRFLIRLQECKGLIPALAKWLKVLKPTLSDLGYNEEQLKRIKTALSKNTVTLDDARLFSERWHTRHGEQVNPSDIYAFFCGGQNAPAAVRLAAK